MLESLLSYLVIFVSVFASLSVLRLLVNFLKALFSDPPKPFELGKSALIFYGIALSYLITNIITVFT